MDFSYVWQYARHFYPGTPWEQILPDPNNASDEAKNKTLDYVIGNDESFGSGFWFMKEMRPEFFNSGEPKENDEQSFRNYVLNGVKADSSDIERRVSVWHTVNNAFVAKQA
ncbi:hypothetical protein LPJ56_000794 [Coemansia sp. RSA 2599]|nr:hypothetical protein LPJ75_000427 [Coemansia sp. RSA 2598]KAJ1828908.1 hypothetical protein LPJ56_000794 [Coemansia sp. RSA 2599]